jgi:hypothetical protein
MPFADIPRRMKINFIYFVILWLNAFPVKTRVSSCFLPRELFVQWELDYKKHCRVLPGSYCKVRDKLSPSNTMVPCTHKAIALGPTGNMQGSVKFYCLKTGQALKHWEFTPLPMPNQIIKQVNAIGAREKQGQDFRFLNRSMEPYEWTNVVPKDDPEFHGLLKEEEFATYPDVLVELPEVELEYKDEDFQVVTDEPVPDFAELAATALDNGGIDPDERLCLANNATANRQVAVPPAIVEADADKVIYKITFDLPDAGLGNNVVPPDPPLQGDKKRWTLARTKWLQPIRWWLLKKGNGTRHKLAGVRLATNHAMTMPQE